MHRAFSPFLFCCYVLGRCPRLVLGRAFGALTIFCCKTKGPQARSNTSLGRSPRLIAAGARGLKARSIGSYKTVSKLWHSTCLGCYLSRVTTVSFTGSHSCP
jgi:hypothetical protein